MAGGSDVLKSAPHLPLLNPEIQKARKTASFTSVIFVLLGMLFLGYFWQEIFFRDTAHEHVEVTRNENLLRGVSPKTSLSTAFSQNESVIAGSGVSDYTWTPIWEFPHDLDIRGSGPLRLYGIKPESAELVGLDSLKNDILYASNGMSNNVDISFPESLSNSSPITGRHRVLPFSIKRSSVLRSPLAHRFAPANNIDFAFVSEQTFFAIAGSALNQTPSEFATNQLAATNANDSFVKKILVTCKDSSHVRILKRILERKGFTVSSW